MLRVEGCLYWRRLTEVTFYRTGTALVRNGVLLSPLILHSGYHKPMYRLLIPELSV
jgi:hypothetical protein